MASFTLDELRVASPCTVPWSGMTGDDTVRFCGDCKKNVYQLSMLTRAEAIELIREKEGNLCVSFYQRQDGTILTSDCPVALRAVKRQYLKARARVVAARVAVCAFLGFVITPGNGFAVQGAPMPPPTLSVASSVHKKAHSADTTHHIVKHPKPKHPKKK